MFRYLGSSDDATIKLIDTIRAAGWDVLLSSLDDYRNCLGYDAWRISFGIILNRIWPSTERPTIRINECHRGSDKLFDLITEAWAEATAMTKWESRCTYNERDYGHNFW